MASVSLPKSPVSSSPGNEANNASLAPVVRYGSTTEVALIRSLRRKRSSLAAMVIRAARLAAILLHVARGLRHADKDPAGL